MNEEIKNKSPRKPYSKPQLEHVQLVLEEAVLTTCKTGGTLGPVVQNCRGKLKCSFQNPT